MTIQEMSFGGEYDYQPEKIIGAAVETIGEDLDFVLWRLGKLIKPKRINLAYPMTDEWFYLCSLLYLDLDSFSLGYIKRMHLGHTWRALMAGTYRWRKTSALQNAITALTAFEDDNWKFQLEHTGDPLHSRIKKQWEEQKARAYIGKTQDKCFKKADRIFQSYKNSTRKQSKVGKHVFRATKPIQTTSGLVTASVSMLDREEKGHYGPSLIK